MTDAKLSGDRLVAADYEQRAAWKFIRSLKRRPGLTEYEKAAELALVIAKCRQQSKKIGGW